MPDASRRAAPPGELDDLTVARARQGDPGASRALIERYQGPVHALLGRLLGPAGRGAEIDDLAQECFLRVFRALPRFQIQGPARLSTWILTIATRLAIDSLRRIRPDSLPHAIEESLAVDEREALRPEQRVLLAEVDALLSTLTPEYRAAFVLRIHHELSYREIAGLLGVEEGTIKSRIARARTALRDALEEVSHD
ncbi:MAG: sigma-70 family RNA polymerase sigma factor [Deltaproteobacteria bacterium]|nr:sigma-70 family RNA polymerase sigma factor [Deltaproteobacteria bacterium]